MKALGLAAVSPFAFSGVDTSTHAGLASEGVASSEQTANVTTSNEQHKSASQDTHTDKIAAGIHTPIHEAFLLQDDPNVNKPSDKITTPEYDAPTSVKNMQPRELVQFILEEFRDEDSEDLFIDSLDNRGDIASLWTFSQVANTLSLAIDSGLAPSDTRTTIETILANYYSDSPDYFSDPSFPAGYNSEVKEELKGINVRYVDDNLWIAEYFMKRYKQTGNIAYIERADGIAKLFIRSWNDSGANGAYWQGHVHAGSMFNSLESKDRAVVSNAPAIPILIELSRLSPDNAHYADIAKDTYSWLRQNLRDPETGMYFDKIEGNGEVDTTLYPYCQAKVIDAIVALHAIDPEQYSLNEAKQLFETSAERFMNDGRLGHNPEFDAMLAASGARLASLLQDSIFTETVRHYTKQAELIARNRTSETELVNIAGTANLALLAQMHPEDWHTLWYTTEPSH